jgi:hypothetical protein
VELLRHSRHGAIGKEEEESLVRGVARDQCKISNGDRFGQLDKIYPELMKNDTLGALAKFIDQGEALGL